MGFMNSYKRLEKLCSEIYNDKHGISAYIDDMEGKHSGAYLIAGWENDLKQLKRYRWIRNQIVHGPDCSEENMCEEKDALWIEDFYTRIINQNDPLTLYRKRRQPQPRPQPKSVPVPKQELIKEAKPVAAADKEQLEELPDTRDKSQTVMIVLFIIIGVVAALLLTLFLR